MKAQISKELQTNNLAKKTNGKQKFYLVCKRLIDILGSFVGLIITFLVACILFIVFQFGDNKGPLFFKQKRVGKFGKIFYILKFRSMVVNAEERLKENENLYKKYVKNNYKLEPWEDPRITKVGRVIRKLSIDELPQFINVLKGEMSLVGPRPIVEEELREYKQRLPEFLAVKPGITGYWQVCGRSEVGYPERVDVELYYVDHQSFLLDIKILCKTIIQVFARKGAF